MIKFDIPDYQKQRPEIAMAPLIDIVFLTLVFFMTISIFNQQETALNISVPKATQATETQRNPGEIIINISKDGSIIVNQKLLTEELLLNMLRRVSNLFPSQAVIIRADENTFHKDVVKVLDVCANADIWNISFATVVEKEKK